MRPIGRMWVKDTVVTGYIVLGPGKCIKFAAPKTNADVDEEVTMIYPSKKHLQK